MVVKHVPGKRNAMVRDAHTRLLHGELIPVEITAACFDPGFQLLVTGARNGTLKVLPFFPGTFVWWTASSLVKLRTDLFHPGVEL